MSKSQLSTKAEEPAAPRHIAIFFRLAYFIGWGAFGLVTLIARQSGIANGPTLFAMAESYQFNGSNLIVPGWFVYLLTRVADFSFSIAGVIMIFMTAGRMGLVQW